MTRNSENDTQTCPRCRGNLRSDFPGGKIMTRIARVPRGREWDGPYYRCQSCRVLYRLTSDGLTVADESSAL